MFLCQKAESGLGINPIRIHNAVLGFKKKFMKSFLHTDTSIESLAPIRCVSFHNVLFKWRPFLYSPRNSQAAYFLLTSLLIYSLYLSWSSTGALRAHLCALALLRMLRSFNQTGMENILTRTQSEN
jgi:hypothetical protein